MPLFCRWSLTGTPARQHTVEEREAEVDEACEDIEKVLHEAQERMRSVEEKVKAQMVATSTSMPQPEENTAADNEQSTVGPVAEGFATEMAEENKEAAGRRKRTTRPRLGAPSKIGAEEAAKEAAVVAQAVEENTAQEEEDPWAALDENPTEAIARAQEVPVPKPEQETSAPGTDLLGETDQIVLPGSELDDQEKVIAGALMSIAKADANAVGGVRALRDALDAIHDCLAPGLQEEQVEATPPPPCPRCASLLAINFRHIATLLDVYADKSVVHEGSWYGTAADSRVAVNTREQIKAPMGSHRVRAVEVILQLVQFGNEFVDGHIIASGVLAKCAKLFFEYPSCSALHCAWSAICEAIFRGPSPALLKDLLVTAGLCEGLAAQSAEVVGLMPGKRPVNTGFVIDLSLAISDLEMACPSVHEYLEKLPGWEAHAAPDGVLAQLLGEQQGPVIGGPLPKSEEEEEDWLDADPARREEELLRVINSFGTTPPPKELVEALERTQMERQMVELDTLELQADLEMRAREQLELHKLEQLEFEQMNMEMQQRNMQQLELELQARQDMEMQAREIQMAMQGVPPPFMPDSMGMIQVGMMAPPPGHHLHGGAEDGGLFYM